MAYTKIQYPVSELTLDLAKAAEGQWLKANYELKPPVVCTLKSLQRRIEKDWIRARDIVRKRETKKSVKDLFDEKLDQLYDITKCQCEIQPCTTSPPCINQSTGKNCLMGASSD